MEEAAKSAGGTSAQVREEVGFQQTAPGAQVGREAVHEHVDERRVWRMRRGRVELSVSDSHPVHVQVPQTPARPLDAEPGRENKWALLNIEIIMHLYKKNELKIWTHR